MVWGLPAAKESVAIATTSAILLSVGLSGAVSSVDVIASGICLLYSLSLSALALPPLPHYPSFGLTPAQQFAHPSSPAKHPAFKVYMGLFGIVGVLLPLVFVGAAWVTGNAGALGEGCSYLFPLLTQILAERVLAKTKGTSLPGFIFLAVWFTALRVARTAQWCQRLIGPVPIAQKVASLVASPLGFSTMEHAVAPLLFLMWSFNLFVFLLFIALPFAFKAYLLGLEQRAEGKTQKVS